MKKRYLLFLPIILLCFTGCEDKKPDENSMLVDENIKLFTDKNQKIRNIKRKAGTFTLNDAENSIHPVKILEKKLAFSRVKQPLLLIHLFPSDCSPCLIHLASFSKLQKKYKKQLFIAGIILDEKKTNPSSLPKYKANLYISSLESNDTFVQTLQNSIHTNANLSEPLTVIYKDGYLYSYFEGLIPIEMIEYDIQQAML